MPQIPLPPATGGPRSEPTIRRSEPEIRKRVFISYSPEDQELYERLDKHLAPLKRSANVIFWNTQEILAGTNWEDEIDTRLSQADVILLLVSPDFIHNKHCWEYETLVALLRSGAGKARVALIILRPTLWRDTLIGQIPALPLEGKPITQWENQDAAFENVVRGIQKIIKGGNLSDNGLLNDDLLDDLLVLEFSENPDIRLPCILLLDTSSSMRGFPLKALNEGLRAFQASLNEDNLASYRVEIAIITFGNGGGQILQDFVIIHDFQTPTLSVSSDTVPMGEAIMLALVLLHKRTTQFQEYGIPYHCPWIFLITNSMPTSSCRLAANLIQSAEQRKELAFFVVGTANVKMQELGQLSLRQPFILEDMRFSELFLWLSRNLKYACGAWATSMENFNSSTLTSTDAWAKSNNGER